MEKPTQRRRARELVLKTLYAAEAEVDEPGHLFDSITEGESLSERQKEFARALFLSTWEHRGWADQQISDLAENWRLERIAIIDLMILRMALIEMERFPDIPIGVVINEAIELAKSFSTAESASFVNGILDRFAKRVRNV
jgi:transcription antitermination protein NusB